MRVVPWVTWVLLAAAAAGCDCAPRCDPILPDAFAASYAQASFCIGSIDHVQLSGTVKVWVDPANAAAYCARTPGVNFPAGTWLVKEMFADDMSCSTLTGYAVMRKLSSANCDWEWQELDADGNVVGDTCTESGISRCVNCHTDMTFPDYDCTALEVRSGPGC